MKNLPIFEEFINEQYSINEKIDMKKLLENLTKEDLIKVVANMHDTIDDWDNGYGLPTKEAETLNKIGSACISFCSEKQDWNLPKVQ